MTQLPEPVRVVQGLGVSPWCRRKAADPPAGRTVTISRGVPMTRCSGRELLIFAAGSLAIGGWLNAQALAQFNSGVSSLGGSSRSSGSTSSGMFGSRTVGGASGLTAGNRSFTSGSANRQTLGQGQQMGGGQGVLNRTLMNDASGGIQNNARFLRQHRSEEH